MKNLKKVLLVSGVVLSTIGVASISSNKINPISHDITENKLMTYNYQAANILDNVFTQDGMTILPFIYKNSDETISKDYVINQFAKAGLKVTNISTQEIVTGTKIQAGNKTYTVLIYGDVDGDGYVDVFDAKKVMSHYVLEGENTLKGIYALAANVDNEDDEIDVFDAQRIVRFYVGYENNIIYKAPISDKEKDNMSPVITLLGDNPQVIKVGTPYKELGATIKDNMDIAPKLTINSSNVNTNKVGTYEVTYNGVDATGNIAKEVKRTVKVENYVKDIEIVATPTKLNYKVGEKIDTTGMKVNTLMGDGSKVDITEYVKLDVETLNLDTTQVNVSYSTKNTLDNTNKTFTKSFTISVSTAISKLEVTEENLEGYRYNEIVIAKVASGRNEEDLEINQLEIEIKDNNGNQVEQEVAKVNLINSLSDGTIELKLTATKAGTYKITPKIKETNIVGDTITVLVTENTEVTDVNITLQTSIKVGESVKTPVSFVHEYASNEIINVDVEAKRLTFEGTGLEITLLDKDETKIDETRPNEPVKYILVKAREDAQAGEVAVKMNIENNSATYTKTMKIEIKKPIKEIKVDATQITLYSTLPQGVDNVVEDDEYGEIYTLVPIKLTVDGVKDTLKYEDIADEIAEGKISITDTTGGYSIYWKAYDSSKQEVDGGNNEVAYIGITMGDGVEEDLRNGDVDVLIYYGNTLVATLPITVPNREISQIVVNTAGKTLEGYCYDTLNIASLTAGQYEESLTADKLEFEIRNSNNEIVSNDIATLTVKNSQLNEGTVDVSIKAIKAGTYTVTPKIKGTNIKGNTITVLVTENTEVTDVNITLPVSIKVGESVKIPVSFVHKYAGNKEVNIDVEAQRITFECTGLEITLLDKDETKIDETRPNEPVEYIIVKAKEDAQAGEVAVKMNIENSSATYTKTMNTEIKKTMKEIKVDATQITLYSTLPQGVDNVIEDDEYGDVYTLVPIELTVDGVKDTLKYEDIADEIAEGKVSITDTTGGYSIYWKAYDSSKQEVDGVNNNNEVAYIGISMAYGVEDDLRAEDVNVLVYYGDVVAATLKINVQ